MSMDLSTVMCDSSVWRVVGEPLAQATAPGPLKALRVAVKDLLAVAGQPIGAGNPTWLREARIEPTHAVAVDALLRAGAEIRGIVQTDEFGYGMFGVNPHYGTPPNPAAPGRVPGGSSSGSASAVASNEADIGLGTDTAGSVRVPASYCALYSFRPTHGIVSNAGRLDLAPSFDTVGWITRDAHVLHQVSDVLLPNQATLPIEELVLAEDLFDLVSPLLRRPLIDAAQRWADHLERPLRVMENTFAVHVEEWAEALGILQAIEMWDAHGAWMQAHQDVMSPHVAAAITSGADMPADYAAWAQETIAEARSLIAEVLSTGAALVHPATAAPAPMKDLAGSGIRAALANVNLVCAASIAGLPVLTVPAAMQGDGPVGLSILGARGSDRALVDLISTCFRTTRR